MTSCSFRLHPLPSAISLSIPRHFLRNPNLLASPFPSPKLRSLLKSKPPTTPLLALTESSEDSPQSLGSSIQSLLQQLSDCFDLPSDYFRKLPNDLRLDLNDAAFDLSNGPVIDESLETYAIVSSPTVGHYSQCGQELGELLLNLSRAWEQGDTSTSPLGRRLVSAGRRFQSMGQYGQGELQKIAQTMITTGKSLVAIPIDETTDKEPMTDTKVFKFGDLQVAITSEKANIGAIIGAVFGILSWQLGRGVQSIPESSLQYANDNALLLAKDLLNAVSKRSTTCALLLVNSFVSFYHLGTCGFGMAAEVRGQVMLHFRMHTSVLLLTMLIVSTA
ncbi:unnamed protein product [Linum tenue]|uniref:Uncharacterized protein n=1 Tax=Linum tenue TaxID=586396 RepID=A0AAV0LGU4_9ROSI|nr:unnamed protein product [Linum tenue]